MYFRKPLVKNKTSKLFGLKKLKLVTRNSNRWTYSPYKVYSNPDQFRLKHMKNQPRVLIREDTKNRKFSVIPWESMFRDEIIVSKFYSKFQKIDLISHKLSDLKRHLHKTRFIVHPTRKREDIHSFGQIKFQRYGEKRIVQIYLNPFDRSMSNNEIVNKTRFMRVNFKNLLTLNVEKRNGKFIIEDPPYENFPKDQHEILKEAVDFARVALKSKQVNPNRHTDISFLTWKDAPKNLEFFDWIEAR